MSSEKKKNIEKEPMTEKESYKVPEPDKKATPEYETPEYETPEYEKLEKKLDSANKENRELRKKLKKLQSEKGQLTKQVKQLRKKVPSKRRSLG